MLRAVFWGTRGSLPASANAENVRAKVFRAIKEANNIRFNTDEEIGRFIDKELPFSVRGSYGTNTSCVEVDGGDEYIVFDAGTGLRDFGNHVLKSSNREAQRKGSVFNIFISHLHWDHIQGFPFFVPAYIPGNRVNIYGFHKELKKAFLKQQNPLNFPVPLGSMSADINFITMKTGRQYEIAGFKIEGKQQNHPNDSYGYRLEKDNKTIIYSTDSEHKEDVYNEDYSFIDFFSRADLLIFDAQYSLLDAISAKENWGHSNNIIAVELSVKAKVKHLCIYHNEPTMSDESLDNFLEDTRKYLKIYADSYPLKISLAYDGLNIFV